MGSVGVNKNMPQKAESISGVGTDLNFKTTTTLRKDFDKWFANADTGDFIVNERGRDKILEEINLPVINMGGTEFDFLTSTKRIDDKGDDIFILHYQSRDKIVYSNGEELYPLLDIGIKSHVAKGGKIKRSFLTGGTARTRLE